MSIQNIQPTGPIKEPQVQPSQKTQVPGSNNQIGSQKQALSEGLKNLDAKSKTSSNNLLVQILNEQNQDVNCGDYTDITGPDEGCDADFTCGADTDGEDDRYNNG